MCGESVALGNQKSHLHEERKLTDGVKARVCLEHNLKVTCGWEMEMRFSSCLSSIEVWNGTIRSMLTGPDGGTIVTLNSRLSTDNFVSGNCVHFIAFFEGLETSEVAAEFTRVCQDGQFTDVSKEEQKIKEDTDFQVDIDVSWNEGIQGEICLFHTAKITCGFDAEILFSTSVTALTVYSMTVIGVEEMPPGSRYQLVNRLRQGAQPENPTCHKFEVRHKENSKPTIKGRYTRACDEGRFTTNPNKGTTPLPTASSPSSSSSSSSSSAAAAAAAVGPIAEAPTAEATSCSPSSCPTSPSSFSSSTSDSSSFTTTITTTTTSTTTTTNVPGLTRSKVVSCYFTNLARDRKGPGHFEVRNIEPDLCTDIIYAFAGIDTSTLFLTDVVWNDLDLYRSLVDLKQKNPSLKIHLAVGETTNEEQAFEIVTSSRRNMNNFAKYTSGFLRTHGFDGLVLHWQFPGSSYRHKFTQLCETLFKQFQKEALVSGMPRLLLSAAVSADKSEIEQSYEPATIHSYLDHINVMSYLFFRPRSSGLHHHSPLYVRDEDRNDPSASFLSQNASIYWWRAMGVPANKLVMGLSTFGSTFIIRSGDSQAALPGAPFYGRGSSGFYSDIPGHLAYYELCGHLNPTGFVMTRMKDSLVPYAYGKRNGNWEWLAYDDVESMTHKAHYIVDNGLGGAMIWTMALDDFAHNECKQGSYPLINAVRNVLIQP